MSIAKIRIALLMRSHSLETWEVNAIRAIQALPYAEIVLRIVDGTPVEQKSFAQKLVRYKWSQLFWKRWFKRFGKVTATREVNTDELLNTIHHYIVVPELKGKYSQHFSAEDIKMVRSYSPDVIIRFGFNILRGEILNVAPHGVWSFHHADHEKIRGGPAGFWEYILGHNVCGAILQRLTEKLDDGVILRRGYFPLIKHSYRENIDTLLNATSGWIANAITEIHLHGKIRHEQAAGNSKAPVFLYPGNFRMLQFWMILLGNKLKFHWKNLFQPETWRIGIVRQPFSEVLNKGITVTPEWITAPDAAEYYADPFSVNFDGRNIILAELYSYREQKGKIVNTETGETFAASPHHSSFPYPILIEDRQYLLPESAESEQVSLYGLSGDSSPIKLVDEPLVDPVLFQYNGKWWLFAHHLHHENNSALFIYSSDGVPGKFVPHPLNPVKIDIRNSRSAGPVIMSNGKLLRPAQDSSRTYGGAIVINEITELTETSFAEREYKRIDPDRKWKYRAGIHTLSPMGNDRTLIDAKSFRFNFANFSSQLKRKSRRIAGK